MSKEGRINLISRTVAVAFFILSFQGCSLGGGTMGTGLSYGDVTPKGSNLAFVIEGRLLASSGAPLKGVKVNARTRAGEETAVTGADGRFSLHVEIASGEQVDFIFFTEKGLSSCSSLVSPAGEERVRMEFKRASSGAVTCP
ncbi:MAG: carboxypeptidase regulatory-like domain-containing protein [Deltaproteobacteria bacterium]|nr:carboxypeptidase regulatory-like domain-containing protein [Deltaproteobacteria bacterium]